MGPFGESAGTSVSVTETGNRSLVPSTLWGHRKKMAVWTRLRPLAHIILPPPCPWTFQVAEMLEIHFCCRDVTQSVVYCYTRWNGLRLRWSGIGSSNQHSIWIQKSSYWYVGLEFNVQIQSCHLKSLLGEGEPNMDLLWNFLNIKLEHLEWFVYSRESFSTVPGTINQ